MICSTPQGIPLRRLVKVPDFQDFFLMTARDMKTFEVFINSELRELKEWCKIKNNSTKLNLGQNQAFVRSPKMYLKV